MKTHTKSLSLLSLGLCALLTGCASSPSQSSDAALAMATFQDDASGALKPDPSLMGLDRSNWGSFVFEVPHATITHDPNYALLRPAPTATAREAGLYPTAESAVDTSRRGLVSGFTDAANTHFRAAIEVVSVPIQAVLAWPDGSRGSDHAGFERAPEHVQHTSDEAAQ